MGHADSRMVEGIYGKVKPMELAPVIAARLHKSESNLVGSRSEMGAVRRRRQLTRARKIPRNAVPRDGIDLPVRSDAKYRKGR